GLTVIAERTTTVPRLNGPASAGTTTDRPNGAPLYGPVRNTGSCALPACGTYTGSGPGPALTTTCPIWLAAGQVPWLACGSGHSCTWESIPSSPGGVVTVSP